MFDESNELPRGMCIAGRFTIEHRARRGSWGPVYRAIDDSTGQPVALELLPPGTVPGVASRFNRGAELLSGLRHPGLVSYVAHGSSEHGLLYLAMEWLEGEDLAQRLTRQPLELPEALSLLRRAAEALSVAHQQGIIHRDLKPSNFFLRGGRPEDVVVLGFGLARESTPDKVLVTVADAIVGSPGYMSPEQASAQSEILPAADIFSLGCVFYECLSGTAPFKAPHFSATLAKILYAEPVPLHTLRTGLPESLSALVDRMLAKDPRRRLANADELLEALSAWESTAGLRAHSETAPLLQTEPGPTRPRGAEPRLMNVLRVFLPELAPGAREAEAERDMGALRTALVPQGARLTPLPDGSLVITQVLEHGSVTEQTSVAARCALIFKERWPEASVVLATGLGVLDKHLPVGGVVDKAERLLRRLAQAPSPCVVLDEVTAGLLGEDFQCSRHEPDSFLLRGKQPEAGASPPSPGEPTPPVKGKRKRNVELALLDFTLGFCIQEPCARALLVTGPAGVGKSWLCREFLRQLEDREPRPLVVQGRGDPVSTGATYGVLGQALRRLCGIEGGMDLAECRIRLAQRIARHLPELEARMAAEFLGELCAIPFAREDSPRLKAVRNAPRAMVAALGRALVAFLKAECAHRPVLLVLEDLHWSDGLTVKLVDEVLRGLAEQPFLVLALARPEVKERFPGLWPKFLQEVPLF